MKWGAGVPFKRTQALTWQIGCQRERWVMSRSLSMFQLLHHGKVQELFVNSCGGGNSSGKNSSLCTATEVFQYVTTNVAVQMCISGIITPEKCPGAKLRQYIKV